MESLPAGRGALGGDMVSVTEYCRQWGGVGALTGRSFLDALLVLSRQMQ